MSTAKVMEHLISRYISSLQQIELQSRGEVLTPSKKGAQLRLKSNSIKAMSPKVKGKNPNQGNQIPPESSPVGRRISALAPKRKNSMVSDDSYEGSFASKGGTKLELKEVQVDSEKNNSSKLIREEFGPSLFQFNEHDIAQFDDKSQGNIVKSPGDSNDERSVDGATNGVEGEDEVIYPLGEQILALSEQLFEKIDTTKTLFDDFVQSSYS